MKKVLPIMLVVLLVFGLFGCAAGGKKTAGLEVGFGRIMIVPDYEVQLSGGM